MTSAQAIDLINSVLMQGYSVSLFLGFIAGLTLAKVMDT